jgi:hypothetical protein
MLRNSNHGARRIPPGIRRFLRNGRLRRGAARDAGAAGSKTATPSMRNCGTRAFDPLAEARGLPVEVLLGALALRVEARRLASAGKHQAARGLIAIFLADLELDRRDGAPWAAWMSRQVRRYGHTLAGPRRQRRTSSF